MKMIDSNKNNQVVKSNDLIKAMGELSSTSSKMLAMLVSMIRSDDSEFQEYALSIDSYLEAVSSTSKNTDFVKSRALELMNNPFYIFNKKGKKDYFNWCSKVSPYELDGYIIFDIHRDLKPHLINLQGSFTKYHITNILSLKGDYSPRLYENFLMRFNEFKDQYKKKYKKSPKSFTFEIEIDWLKDYLSIPSSYRYNNIKERIIEVAKKQFLEKTDIKFTYKEQKLGKKVVRLVFKIENNDKGSNDYLMDIHSFIKYMRINYINQDIWKGQGMILSISENGRIYNKNTSREYTHKDSQSVWDKWYELAKENKLLILKQGVLF